MTKTFKYPVILGSMLAGVTHYFVRELLGKHSFEVTILLIVALSIALIAVITFCPLGLR